MNAHYPAENPIGIFPPSKIMDLGIPNEAIEFINGMVADGGGIKLGEAMIDGLNGANSLIFRKESKRVYILVGDDTPHGD